MQVKRLTYGNWSYYIDTDNDDESIPHYAALSHAAKFYETMQLQDRIH